MDNTSNRVDHVTIYPAEDLSAYFGARKTIALELVEEGAIDGYYCNDQLWVDYNELYLVLDDRYGLRRGTKDEHKAHCDEMRDLTPDETKARYQCK